MYTTVNGDGFPKLNVIVVPHKLVDRLLNGPYKLNGLFHGDLSMKDRLVISRLNNLFSRYFGIDNAEFVREVVKDTNSLYEEETIWNLLREELIDMRDVSSTYDLMLLSNTIIVIAKPAFLNLLTPTYIMSAMSMVEEMLNRAYRSYGEKRVNKSSLIGMAEAAHRLYLKSAPSK